MKAKIIYALFLLTICAYLFGVMVELEWNPLQWLVVTRALIGWVVGSFWLVTGWVLIMYGGK